MYEVGFPKRLSQLRLAKGVSAREMSLALGQNENYINNIENNKALPSMTSFMYICEYLDITPYEFFDFEAKDPDRCNKLMQEIRKLDSSKLELLENIIREFRRTK
ncbi:MAG: helix-turn-helix domain-containing protein [Clostridia bacterium]|nr:helix-turn-helix domain-containing protein [Clostridia bacterium]